ncbi:hypothetical protein DVA67_000680 [Solirubrobacter sp. CPCC 204708]|uniref:Uncharacterized protein n=1 Tax=Solirubrobacter deserti TaxID=2282478 RepID=A0ABT4RM54_9ACTN|nr:hypothetical protein [Solirubrobacter deserti]MBE2314472.1 hypothetical protein [Solirubrobacter deserti]MDA0139619.1 hypothetical protein [Solirubrobacter deserti]
METTAEPVTETTTFGPPDADYQGIADAPDAAFDEADDDYDIETPDDGEPDGLD